MLLLPAGKISRVGRHANDVIPYKLVLICFLTVIVVAIFWKSVVANISMKK